MKYEVYVNNVSTGIIETNYKYASMYWKTRKQFLECAVELRELL